MAIEIKNTNYSGEVLEEILTLAATGNELVERGLIHVEPNVSKKISVPRLTMSDDILQKRKEMPTDEDSQGNFDYSEKVLEPVDFMAFTTFNPRKLEHIWRKWQPKGNLVFSELPAEVQNKFLAELLKLVKFELGWHYINGKFGNGKKELFNGIVFRIKEENETIKAGSSAVSMIGKLYALRSQIPVTLLDNPNLRILMNKKEFERYDMELTKQTAKGVNHTDISPRFFKGIKIEDLAQWPAGFITATLCSPGLDGNFYAAVNLQDDEDVIQIDKLSNAGEKYFFKLLMKADTNIAFGQECVVLERVAPRITADKTELEFPAEGGEVEVIINTTEEYFVESIPEGYTATESGNGLLVSAEPNTGAEINDTIVLSLKEHTSRKLRISVSQPNA